MKRVKKNKKEALEKPKKERLQGTHLKWIWLEEGSPSGKRKEIVCPLPYTGSMIVISH